MDKVSTLVKSGTNKKNPAWSIISIAEFGSSICTFNFLLRLDVMSTAKSTRWNYVYKSTNRIKMKTREKVELKNSIEDVDGNVGYSQKR